MTVFRGNAEPDPMPESVEQLAQSAASGQKAEGLKATFTGQDAGLSQSLADLRKGYADAAKVQSEADQQAALNRTMADAEIDANVPHPAVQFIDHRPEQYIAGDSSQIPSSDPAWRIPLDHLRENLQLTEATFGAVDRLTKTGSPKDFQIAAELGERLQTSMARDFNPQPQQPSPQGRPETFPDGEVVHVTQNADGTLSAEYVTGERFSGDPLSITQQIAKSHILTKKWAQQQRAQAEQQQNGSGEMPSLIPSSQVQYDEYGAPILQMGQSEIPTSQFQELNKMATLLGYSDANEMVSDQINLRQQTERLSQELQADRENRQSYDTAAVFLAQNPDFPNDQTSIAVLDQIIARNGLEWSADNMRLAHLAAVRDGLYQPLSVEAQQAAAGLAVQHTRPTPPPMLRSGNPESSFRTEDVRSMPLAELRRLAIQQELEGKGSSVNYR